MTTGMQKADINAIIEKLKQDQHLEALRLIGDYSSEVQIEILLTLTRELKLLPCVKFSGPLDVSQNRIKELSQELNEKSPLITSLPEASSSETKPFLAKTKLTWDLVQFRSKKENLEKYLREFKKKEIKVGDEECMLYDLTSADDYQFIVTTVTCNPSFLLALAKGEPDFLMGSPYFSGSLIDKITRGYWESTSQGDLFPMYLGLDVPSAAIAFTAPEDIGSPTGRSDQEKLKKQKFLDEVIPARKEKDAQIVAAQLRVQKEHYFPPPSSLSRGLQTTRRAFPFYTAEQILKKSDNSKLQGAGNAYNELIIERNRAIKVRMVIIEKRLLDKFNNTFPLMEAQYKKAAYDSLQILKNLESATHGRLKLVLVDTDILSYARKLPLVRQIELLTREKSSVELEYAKSHLLMECLKISGNKNERIEKWHNDCLRKIEKLAAWQTEIEHLVKSEEDSKIKKKP